MNDLKSLAPKDTVNELNKYIMESEYWKDLTKARYDAGLVML